MTSMDRSSVILTYLRMLNDRFGEDFRDSRDYFHLSHLTVKSTIRSIFLIENRPSRGHPPHTPNHNGLSYEWRYRLDNP
ncbi:hypothetical protein P3X46_007167, partial [Hevea brasiliensis]